MRIIQERGVRMNDGKVRKRAGGGAEAEGIIVRENRF